MSDLSNSIQDEFSVSRKQMLIFTGHPVAPGKRRSLASTANHEASGTGCWNRRDMARHGETWRDMAKENWMFITHHTLRRLLVDWKHCNRLTHAFHHLGCDRMISHVHLECGRASRCSKACWLPNVARLWLWLLVRPDSTLACHINYSRPVSLNMLRDTLQCITEIHWFLNIISHRIHVWYIC